MIAVSYYLEQTRKEDRKNELNTGIEDKHLLPFIIVVVLSFGAILPDFWKSVPLRQISWISLSLAFTSRNK